MDRTRSTLTRSDTRSSVQSTASDPSEIFSLSRSNTDSSLDSESVPLGPPWHWNQPSELHEYDYDLPCEFTFLGCEVRFHPLQWEAWMTHTLSHFNGVPPPVKSICIFCDDKQAYIHAPEDPSKNWTNRMIHIGHHWASQAEDTPLRPDYWLIDYMREHGLVTDEDYSHAIEHSERPKCDGLKSPTYETEEMKTRKKRDMRVPHDLQREERQRKRERTSVRDSGRKHRI